MGNPVVSYSDAIKEARKDMDVLGSDMKIIDSVFSEVSRHKELFEKYEIGITFQGNAIL
jgi:hypothetical protein